MKTASIGKKPGRPRGRETLLSKKLCERGKSMAEAALELGVGRGQAYKIFARTSTPSPDVARRLARFLGISLEEVFWG